MGRFYHFLLNRTKNAPKSDPNTGPKSCPRPDSFELPPSLVDRRLEHLPHQLPLDAHAQQVALLQELVHALTNLKKKDNVYFGMWKNPTIIYLKGSFLLPVCTTAPQFCCKSRKVKNSTVSGTDRRKAHRCGRSEIPTRGECSQKAGGRVQV